MLRPRLRLASPLPCALSCHKPGSLDEGPSHFNAGTAPRFAVSLSALWRAAWQSQVKAVAWACCCLGVLPISWGPSVVSTCAGDVSGRAAHICTRGTPKPPQVAGRAALPACPGVPTALARPPSGGTQVPGLRRPRRWVGGAGKPPARRSPLRGPARPWKELAQAGACCSTKLRGRGQQPRSAGEGPEARTGGRGADRRPPCSPAPWSSPPAWRSAPCSGSRARGRRSAPRVSTSDEKFPAASGSGYVSQF